MYYQLTYIVPSDIADFAQLEKIISSISGQITEAGGTLKEPLAGTTEVQSNENYVSSEELKKVAEAQKVTIFKHRLSYPVKHHRFGFYVSNLFSIEEKNPAAVLKKMNTVLKMDKNVIRFITVAFDLERTAKQVEERKKIRTGKEISENSPKAAESDNAQNPAPSEEVKKTKIEDLDKKLEQILNA